MWRSEPRRQFRRAARTGKIYIHRVGRTARAKRRGDAFTLVSPEEESDFAQVERLIGIRVPRSTIPGFDYTAPREVADRPATADGRRNPVAVAPEPGASVKVVPRGRPDETAPMGQSRSAAVVVRAPGHTASAFINALTVHGQAR